MIAIRSTCVRRRIRASCDQTRATRPDCRSCLRCARCRCLWGGRTGRRTSAGQDQTATGIQYQPLCRRRSQCAIADAGRCRHGVCRHPSGREGLRGTRPQPGQPGGCGAGDCRGSRLAQRGRLPRRCLVCRRNKPCPALRRHRGAADGATGPGGGERPASPTMHTTDGNISLSGRTDGFMFPSGLPAMSARERTTAMPASCG